MFPQIKTYSKRSAAAEYFRKYFKGRSASSDSKTFTNLVLTTKDELGWCCLISGTKERRITFGKGKDVVAEPNSPNRTWYKIIQPESSFIHRGHLFVYRGHKVSSDYSIVPVHIVDSVKYVQNLNQDEGLTYRLCAVKTKKGEIINYAWAAFKDEVLAAQYPVFQDEKIDYKLNKVNFEIMEYDEEFIFADNRWYVCTEGGHLALGRLPLPKRYNIAAMISA